MVENESIAGSLLDTVTDSNAVDALASLGEVALDSILGDNVVKDIPVVGTIVSLARAGLAVRDRLFLRKVWRFVTQLNSIPKDEREEFRRRLERDPGQRKQVGETLLVLLDRLDELAKPALIARAFEGYIRGKISFVDFQRLAKAIDRVMLAEDLQRLQGWDPSLIGRLPSGVGLSLQGAGLVEPRSVPNTPYVGGTLEYQKTGLGTQIVEIVLSQPHRE